MVGLIYIYDLPDRKCKLIVIKMLSKVRKATDEQCENMKKEKIFFKISSRKHEGEEYITLTKKIQ